MNKIINQQPVTKNDFNNLRTDVKKIEKSLRAEILHVEEKVEVLEERFDTLEEKIEIFEGNMTSALTKLQNTLDGFVGTVDNLRTEKKSVLIKFVNLIYVLRSLNPQYTS